MKPPTKFALNTYTFRMASADQDIGDELVTCTICLEHFTSPKTLVCLHTFCESCLRRHLMVYQTQRRGNLSTIPCPTCRELTPLPQMGVAGLRTDFKIAKIADFLAQIAGKAKVTFHVKIRQIARNVLLRDLFILSESENCFRYIKSQSEL